jgi:nucleotide-binding universal stress UspA family protein
MKKIIAAFDGLKYSESTALYALDIAKRYNGKVFGIFLEDFTYHSYNLSDLASDDYPEVRAAYLNKTDAQTREFSIKHFANQCEEQGILYAIHRDKNIAIRDLLHETRYGDLVVVQNNETLTHYSESAPSGFIMDLLGKTECPILLVPPHYKKVEKIIFLYDGEASSVFAIKQFSYLMPGQRQTPVELLCVKRKGENQAIPDSSHMREWLKLYHDDVQYKIIVGDPNEEIVKYLREQISNCLVVTGAYERNAISRILHKSMADRIMNAVELPMFISHS